MENPGTSNGKTERVVKDEVRRTVDDAALLREGGKAYEAGAASNRQSLDATQSALVASYARIDTLTSKLEASEAERVKLLEKLAEEKAKDRKTKKKERQLELKKEKVKTQGKVLESLIKSAGPLMPAVAPRLMLLADKYLPQLVDIPADGDRSPRAALMRLIAKIYDPNPEEAGPEVLQCLQDLAGPDDWHLVQIALWELANAPPAEAAAETAPAASTSGAAASGPGSSSAPSSAPAAAAPPGSSSAPSSAPAAAAPAAVVEEILDEVGIDPVGAEEAEA